MKTKDYIDALRVKLGARSYYHLSQLIGIPESQIRRYRKSGTFDNSMAARVANLLEIDTLTVIADMEMERAKDEKTRELWAALLSKAAAVAGCALIGIGASVAPPPASALNITPVPEYKFSTRRKPTSFDRSLSPA